MLLVRLAYAAELPTPADMVRRLEESGDTAPSPSPSKGSSGPAGNGARAVATPGQASMAPDTLAASPAAEPEAQAIAPRTQIISNFEAAVQLFNEKREGRLYVNLMQDVAPVAFEPGRIELSPGPNAPPDLAARASAKLGEWAGERWIVTMTQSEGGQSLADREAAAREAERDAALSDPLVQQVLKTFPGAEVTLVEDIVSQPEPEEPVEDDSAVNETDT